MTTASIQWAISRLQDKFEEVAAELNELDGAIGDGDLGATLTRAGEALMEDLPNLPDDVGMALFKCAQTIGRVSAGTFGTLLATGLMAAAKAARGRIEVPWIELSPLLGAALKSMSDRGRAQLGDKTVLDAIEAARRATQGLQDPQAIAEAANRAVEAALDHFRALPFRQGRARIFGEQAIGRNDPGMIAFQRMIEAVADEVP